MCTCASCEYTDAFSGRADLFRDGSPNIKGFDLWPRGEPAGPRSSAAAYAAHVLACPPIAKPWKFVPPRNDRPPITEHQFPKRAPKRLLNWINREWEEKRAEREARPASPAVPCKAPQHFPAQDRPRETALIYAMPKAKTEKRPRGRPPLPGRRIVIKLEEEQIKRAEKLGDGNVAAGIRKALTSRSNAHIS